MISRIDYNIIVYGLAPFIIEWFNAFEHILVKNDPLISSISHCLTALSGAVSILLIIYKAYKKVKNNGVTKINNPNKENQ